FLMVSLTAFGGDDGLNIYEPSNFGFFELAGSAEVFWAAWAVLLILTLFLTRFRTSPFGMVLRATHINPRRVDAFGYSVFRVQLSAYVLSGVITGMAGFLLANLTAFAVPSYISWHVSGELIVMIIIGGLGTVLDRKSTRLNSSHVKISYAVFCLNDCAPPRLYPLSLHDALPI